MINIYGKVQNNGVASDFIRNQKKLNSVFKVLDKDAERKLIESYVRLKLDENGKPTYNEEFDCDFEWIGDEHELREKLVMHNIQAVTRTTAKHCQDTRDYDNMYAKGLYGLVKAANMFHPFKLITKIVGYELDEEGKRKAIREVKYDDDGNFSFVKFITFAQPWIFKYVMDEFYSKDIKIDNNSTSLDEMMRVQNDNSKTTSFENYISNIIAPEVELDVNRDEVARNEITSLVDSIKEYIETSSDISSLERGVLEETYFNGVTNTRKLATIFGVPMTTIEENQTSALSKLKLYLYDEYGISELSDLM